MVKPNADDTLAAGGAALLLTGRSAGVARLRAELAAAVPASRVLIVAEAGLDTAELAAELHDRAGVMGRFVRLDCSAAEPPIIERELFGAVVTSVGDLEVVHGTSALARSDGGSLFLGDLAELSAGAQARLARIARDGEVVIDGTPRRLDVRLFASVGPDVDSDIAAGRLRRDLIRHIARTRISVPPLRQRADDLTTLVEHLVLFSCADAGVPVKDVTQPAMTLLAAMPWRGNMQELRTAIERLVTTVDGSLIQLEDVLHHVRFDRSLVPTDPTGSLRAAREQFERDYVTLVLRHHHWRVSDAARTLGIQRTNLYRKARQLGITVTRPTRRA
jgi:DNA-binding NtrC family response regulator